MSRRPRHPIPNRVGSSAVNITSFYRSPQASCLTALHARAKPPARPAPLPCRHTSPRAESRPCASRLRPPAAPVPITLQAQKRIAHRILAHRKAVTPGRQTPSASAALPRSRGVKTTRVTAASHPATAAFASVIARQRSQLAWQPLLVNRDSSKPRLIRVAASHANGYADSNPCRSGTSPDVLPDGSKPLRTDTAPSR